jgi:hypothetical protein
MLIGSNEDDVKFIIEQLSFKMLTSYRLRIFIHYHNRTHITGLPSDERTLTKALVTVTAQIPRPTSSPWIKVLHHVYRQEIALKCSGP